MVVDIADRQVDNVVEKFVTQLAHYVLTEEGAHAGLEEACCGAGEEHCGQGVQHVHQLALPLPCYYVDGLALQRRADEREDTGQNDHDGHADQQADLTSEIGPHAEECAAHILRLFVSEVIMWSSRRHQLSFSLPIWDS